MQSDSISRVFLVVFVGALLCKMSIGEVRATDPACLNVEAPVGECDDREQAYAMILAHLQWLLPQYTAEYGPGYQVCLDPYVSPNKFYAGLISTVCGVVPGARNRYWTGSDCPAGRVWDEPSHACISPTPFNAAKGNECAVTGTRPSGSNFFRSGVHGRDQAAPNEDAGSAWSPAMKTSMRPGVIALASIRSIGND